MAIEWLKRLFGGPTGRTLQQQVDAEARSEHARRARERRSDSIFGDATFSSPNPAQPDGGSQTGGGFGTIIPGFGALKGIGQLAEYLQQGRPWFDQLNGMAQALDPMAREIAVRSALSQLSPESSRNLDERLASKIVEGGDPVAFIAGTLGGTSGFERLIQSLTAGSAPASMELSEWASDRRDPAPAEVNALQAMRDPLIRDLARTLIPALVQAGQDGGDKFGVEDQAEATTTMRVDLLSQAPNPF